MDEIRSFLDVEYHKYLDIIELMVKIDENKRVSPKDLLILQQNDYKVNSNETLENELEYIINEYYEKVIKYTVCKDDDIKYNKHCNKQNSMAHLSSINYDINHINEVTTFYFGTTINAVPGEEKKFN